MDLRHQLPTTSSGFCPLFYFVILRHFIVVIVRIWSYPAAAAAAAAASASTRGSLTRQSLAVMGTTGEAEIGAPLPCTPGAGLSSPKIMSSVKRRDLASRPWAKICLRNELRNCLQSFLVHQMLSSHGGSAPPVVLFCWACCCCSRAWSASSSRRVGTSTTRAFSSKLTLLLLLPPSSSWPLPQQLLFSRGALAEPSACFLAALGWLLFSLLRQTILT